MTAVAIFATVGGLGISMILLDDIELKIMDLARARFPG